MSFLGSRRPFTAATISVGVRPRSGPLTALIGLTLAITSLGLIAAVPATANPVGVPTGQSGIVSAWGNDEEGETSAPAGLTDAIAIAGGNYTSYALKSDGTVAAWGYDFYGQATVPAGLTGVTAISAGFYHALALKSDHTVAAWGLNDNGQTTVPPGLTGVTAIAAGAYFSLALKSDGSVVAWGSNSNGETTVPTGLMGVTSIAASGYHALALKSDGSVVAWGRNGSGESTVPDGLNGVTAIAGARYHSLALKNDGTVVAWGANNNGQLAVPPGLSGVTAIAGGFYHSLALKADGTVVSWGSDSDGQATVPSDLTGVLAIAGGAFHSLVLKSVPAPPSFTADAPPTTVQAGMPVDYNFTASGTPAATFAVPAGQLPAGLSLSAAGLLTGTTNVAGSYNFTVTASNENLPDAVSTSHTIVVAPGTPIAAMLSSSVAQVARGGTIILSVSGTDSYGNVIDLTSQAVFTSDWAVDVIAGNTVTFPHASPHVITGRVGSLTSSVTIEVVAPTVTASTAADGSASALAYTGTNPLPAILGGAGTLLLGLLFSGITWSRRRRQS